MNSVKLFAICQQNFNVFLVIIYDVWNTVCHKNNFRINVIYKNNNRNIFLLVNPQQRKHILLICKILVMIINTQRFFSTCNIIMLMCYVVNWYIHKLHVDVNRLPIDILMLHVNMYELYVNKLFLHVDIIPFHLHGLDYIAIGYWCCMLYLK